MVEQNLKEAAGIPSAVTNEKAWFKRKRAFDAAEANAKEVVPVRIALLIAEQRLECELSSEIDLWVHEGRKYLWWVDIQVAAVDDDSFDTGSNGDLPFLPATIVIVADGKDVTCTLDRRVLRGYYCRDCYVGRGPGGCWFVTIDVGHRDEELLKQKYVELERAAYRAHELAGRLLDGGIPDAESRREHVELDAALQSADYWPGSNRWKLYP
jgi:hypothetical protein